MKKEELLRYSGTIAQIASINKMEYTEGKAKGVAAYQVKTGSGFQFTALPDKCLDIVEASYKGINLSYLFKAGIINPQYFYTVEDGFLQNMCGGLLFTGGLRSAGGGNRDNDGRWYPPHGRISQTPARNAYAKTEWQGENYLMEMGGEMSEASLFGEHLVLKRTIKTRLNAKEFEITDIVENQSPLDDEFMILYHMNLGFPFLDEDTKIIIDSKKSVPVVAGNEKSLEKYASFEKPVDGGGEDCFFHDVNTDSDGYALVRVENKKLNFGVYFKFKKDTLPNLVQWKSYQSTDYALGIEPSNSFIKGRTAERENGTLKKIKGFEQITHTVIFGVYDL